MVKVVDSKLEIVTLSLDALLLSAYRRCLTLCNLLAACNITFSLIQTHHNTAQYAIQAAQALCLVTFDPYTTAAVLTLTLCTAELEFPLLELLACVCIQIGLLLQLARHLIDLCLASWSSAHSVPQQDTII